MSTTQLLPDLQTRKQGEEFRIGLTWAGHLANGESLSTAETEIERLPDDGSDILGDTSIDGERTVIEFAIPSDAEPGVYHLRHVVTTSDENTYTECFSVSIEEC